MTIGRCARCRRPISQPVIVEGRGYGPRCSQLVTAADLLTPKPAPKVTARRRTRRSDARQLQLAERA